MTLACHFAHGVERRFVRSIALAPFPSMQHSEGKSLDVPKRRPGIAWENTVDSGYCRMLLYVYNFSLQCD